MEGILLRWAGRELDQVGKEIRSALRFLLFQQLIVILPLCLIFHFLLTLGQPFEWIALMVLAYAFILNMRSFFQFTAQAVRKFRGLTAVNVGTSLTFLITIICLFTFGYLDYTYMVYGFLLTSALGLAALVLWFREYLQGSNQSFSPLLSYGRETLGIGIFVYLGDLVTALLLTVDRLMINSFFPIEQFAIYAFALTGAMVAYTFVGAVAQVFFPYLSASATSLRTRAYQLAKPGLILAWAATLAVYFPITKLIEFYLPHYTASLPIMQILLCTVGFGSLIQILHANYYKAYRKQRQYFLWGITALGLSAILTLLAIRIFGTLQSVAIAALISFGVWYVVNELSLKSVVEEESKELWRGLGIVCCYLGAFWLASFLADWFVAKMLIYIGFFSLITWLLLGSEVKELAGVADGLRRSFRHRRGRPPLS
jgi:O-antigen/teichoic acid export membrane protein